MSALETTETTEPGEAPWWCRYWRLMLLVAVVVTIYGVASATGVLEQLTLESVKETVLGAGYWGWVIFLAAFALGNLVQVPGQIFVVAGVAVYGPVQGLALSIVGGLVAICFSFWFARLVGGQALEQVQQPFMRKILDRLDERPILTVVILRLIFVMSPPVNYALALSSLRFRDYLIGSLIGLPVPLIVLGLVADRLVQWFA